MPGMQPHSTQARKPKLPSDGKAGRVCKTPDVKCCHSVWRAGSQRRYTDGWWCRTFHRLDRTRKKKNMSIRNKDEAT